MICPRCKNQLPEGSVACNRCGLSFMYSQNYTGPLQQQNYTGPLQQQNYTGPLQQQNYTGPLQQPNNQQFNGYNSMNQNKFSYNPHSNTNNNSVARQGHSGMSVAAFVLSLIGCTSIIGLILGIIDTGKRDNYKKSLSNAAIVISCIWIFLVGFVLFGSDDNTSTSSIQNKSSKTKDYTYVTAKDIYKEFEENQVACKDKYDNKTILISGSIDDIGIDILNDNYITLKSGNKYTINNVQCYFDDDQMDYLKTLKKNDEVFLVGKVNVGSIKLSINDCVPAGKDIIEKYSDDN